MANLFFGNNHLFNMVQPDLKLPPKRHLFMAGPSVLPTVSNKSFTNPNFVNNLNKYQTHTVKSQSDSHCNNNNYKNSSLINSIIEHCPKIIEDPNFCVEDTDRMGFSKTQNIDIKKERSHRKKQPRKSSKQNQNRQLLNEIMDYESLESPQSFSEEDNSPPHLNKFDLNQVIIDKPLKKLISTIPIPLAHNKDVIVTFTSQSPPFRTPQVSKFDSQNKNGHKVYYFDKEGRMTDSLEDIRTVNNTNGIRNIQNIEKDCTLNLDNQEDRLRYPSVCDSEDSFIVFDDDMCQKQNPVNKLLNRHRIPSICESEDSFIVFEGDNDEETSDSDEDLTGFEEGSEVENEDTCESEDESSFDLVEPKKVHFASAEKLCEVHPMVKWAYAYQAARKGPWEELARDRDRFKDRIKNTERKIAKAFEKNHRETVYETRFKEN